ncbi:nuclear protein Qri2/Nse4 [Penicillium hispanicum]|uniref:nuclear protein Qri2/Nse4 n=1 Tax=Penicillium hispanicum TaxID=1080232 RepID=UPI0025406046|nr:nuclear protein Qri2/Nse4 [Penicillium hispanicum]KAJ5573966.1 nuclear protein Qri2/Nse4 [Penicillium hispanicum]
MAPFPHSQLDETTPHSSSAPTSPDSSSDKENPRRSVNKRVTTQMPPLSQASKRQRLSARSSNIQSQVSSSQQHLGNRWYDPDQEVGERRRTRKEYRDLDREFMNSRDEYLQPGNDGILRTVNKANVCFHNVKQTSDATIDSRLLVNAADLSHKKTAQLALGDSTVGIDVDEFVSKCISYMRRGPDTSASQINSAPRRRNRPSQTQRDYNNSDEEDEGDAMNWDWLGRTACFPYNARPAVSGWLLGPLSVQKRTRQFTQRTAVERFDDKETVQPQDLQQKDLDQQENSNLTVMCSKINKLLADSQKKSEAAVNSILSGMNDFSPETLQDVMDQHNVADDGGIPLFRFCINPRSFGQSVENLFYVSFLVRDGTVGLSTDSRQLPTLHSAVPYAPSEAQKKGIQKHQAVFSLDFDTWKQLIDVFRISKSIIPHREEQEETVRTWYG